MSVEETELELATVLLQTEDPEKPNTLLAHMVLRDIVAVLTET